MKPIIKYQCELCKTMYNCYEEAIECEKKHIKPKDIVSALFINPSMRYGGYPSDVVIRFTNGEKYTYQISDSKRVGGE